MSEFEALAALRAGDARALEAAYRVYADRIFNFLCRLARHRDLARELSQEVWLRLARFAPRLREDTNLEAWLFTVARNVFMSNRRFVLLDAERVRTVAWAFFEREPPPAPDAILQTAFEAAAAERALSRLCLADREILLLSLQSELAPADVAKTLGLTHDAYRQRLSRARNRFVAQVKK